MHYYVQSTNNRLNIKTKQNKNSPVSPHYFEKAFLSVGEVFFAILRELHEKLSLLLDFIELDPQPQLFVSCGFTNISIYYNDPE